LCPSCSQPATAGKRFCGECGAALLPRCPACGALAPPGKRFCEDCGGPLDLLAAAQSPAPAAPSRPPDALASAEIATRPGAARAGTAPLAERRQLTVLFCDVAGSSALAERLDPEDLRDLLRAYQDACAEVIARFEGHLARVVGDGLLVYFGYPHAHEDDAQRAVRAALGIVEALGWLNARLAEEQRSQGAQMQGEQLAVRLGIHTGLVVVGDMGDADRRDPQAVLGAVPNVAARLQDLAPPNGVLMSAVTHHLVAGYFACTPLGSQTLKGMVQPLEVFRVLHESMARSRLDAAGPRGLTPLVGRHQELGLLRERWEQVQDGLGQVVILSGEAGIGKSRLVRQLQEHVAADPQAWLTPCQCSPYFQHSALYPFIDLLERVVLQFTRDESPAAKLRKLEGFLAQYGLDLPETVPLFADLLSLPLSQGYASLDLSAEQERQRTLQAVVNLLLRRAARQPVLFVMEDLHWADPTTLEALGLLVDQAPLARILALWTCRPEFTAPWTGRAHGTHLTLSRLTRRQVAEMVAQVTGEKPLPAEVHAQIVERTDGVPLFVEELTRTVLESGLLRATEERFELTGPLPPLAIPATLHDSLLARLDRLGEAKEVAQLAAALGREFSYELLAAVAPWEEPVLRAALARLVEAELLYQRGLQPEVTYTFKHALIQEAAYQSQLKSRRQQVHRRIAEVLAARLPETAATQPELLAHHYTEAGLAAEALPCWYRAGRQAVERSAYVEGISHLGRGVALVPGLPDTPQRAWQELDLQVALGLASLVTKGYTAMEVEQAYSRARDLCHQVGDVPRLVPILRGIWAFHHVRGAQQTTRELSSEMLRVAEEQGDPEQLLTAHYVCGQVDFWGGGLATGRAHLEQCVALYERWYTPQRQRLHLLTYGQDFGMMGLEYLASTLALQGYVEQALVRHDAVMATAQEAGHPFTHVHCLVAGMPVRRVRREAPAAQHAMEMAAGLATEHRFPDMLATAQAYHGWALCMQGHVDQGLAELHRGIEAPGQRGADQILMLSLSLLAEVHMFLGQTEEGLAAVANAAGLIDRTGQSVYLAELHRLRGELLLEQDAAAAEDCFAQALAVSREQGAHAFELRAALSLSRLWHRQGKTAQAHAVLAECYSWFTEGFDTADLQAAGALLDELGGTPTSPSGGRT
jgi:class 3 adenylate cyclase/predicted ATPase